MNSSLTLQEFKVALENQILVYKETNDPIPEVNEKSFERISSYLEMPFQTGYGQELYPTIYDKAAILCYLIIKNHALSNGNKRMGIVSMLLFLEKNNAKYNKIQAYSLAKYIASSDSNDKEKVLQYIKEKITPMAINKKDIQKLEKVIADPKTSQEQKERFQKILDKIKEDEGMVPAKPAEDAPAPTETTVAKTDKPKKVKKKKEPTPDASAPKVATPSCDELIEKFKAAKKARLERQKARKEDTRKPDTKLRDEADKKITDTINKIMKLSKKGQLSKRVKKDVLEILREGVSHISKV